MNGFTITVTALPDGRFEAIAVRQGKRVAVSVRPSHIAAARAVRATCNRLIHPRQVPGYNDGEAFNRHIYSVARGGRT